MKTSWVLTSIVALTLCLSLSCAGAGGSSGGGSGGSSGGTCSELTSSGGGSSAPDFTLDDMDGNAFHLADHVGQEVILLNFWATWCEPCRVEMPHLDRLQESYRDRGLRVLAISMDGPESVSRVRSHVNRYDFALTVLLDHESEVSQLYNPRRAAPLNVIIDREGEITWTREGYNPGDEEELEHAISCALGPSSSAP